MRQARISNGANTMAYIPGAEHAVAQTCIQQSLASIYYRCSYGCCAGNSSNIPNLDTSNKFVYATDGHQSAMSDLYAMEYKP